MRINHTSWQGAVPHMSMEGLERMNTVESVHVDDSSVDTELVPAVKGSRGTTSLGVWSTTVIQASQPNVVQNTLF